VATDRQSENIGNIAEESQATIGEFSPHEAAEIASPSLADLM